LGEQDLIIEMPKQGEDIKAMQGEGGYKTRKKSLLDKGGYKTHAKRGSTT